MAKKVAKQKQTTNSVQILDVGAFVLALWFTYTVILNARDLIEQGVKNSPGTIALLVAVLLVANGRYQHKRFTITNLITLAVLATASAIWLFGLSSRAVGY